MKTLDVFSCIYMLNIEIIYYFKDQNAAVYLFTTPPKAILNSKSSLIDENCFPSAILHFGQEGKEATQLQVQ